MTFFQKLMEGTEQQRQQFLAIPLLRQGIAGEITREQYIAFLTQAYHHVKHTLPLLMACGANLSERLEWLREAVSHYIEEETGHQEWILNDIRHAGGNAEAVRHGQPSLPTELMVSYAWDTVQRRNPVGFFGMVLVLEGTSVRLATEAAAAIQRQLGLGPECFSYLTSHGALDISHLDFFQKLMDRLDDPADQMAVIHCARVMYQLYGDIFRELQNPEGMAA